MLQCETLVPRFPNQELRHVATKRTKIVVGVVLCIGIGGCLAISEGFLRLQDKVRKASCRPRIVLLTCTHYAADHEGQFPPLSPDQGTLFYDVPACKDWIRLPTDQICEFDREGLRNHDFREFMYSNPLNDWSYVYLSYFIEDEAQGLAFADAYEKVVASSGAFQEDLSLTTGKGNLGHDRLYRLRTPETLPQDLAALGENAGRIPVVIEWPGNHRKLGGHVVFLDGHTEYMAYPGEFPMTEPFIEALRFLDALGQTKSTESR